VVFPFREALAATIGFGVVLASGCSLTENLDDLKSASEGGTCVPKTCAQLGAECGLAIDGCGGAIECGECSAGKYCGGDGANQCGDFPCKPATCAAVSAECGNVSDGCDALLDCGNCTGGSTCGGTGRANQCGCQPKTCADLGAECGTQNDGCGATIECGVCEGGDTCGGGGANKCGTGSCQPKTCASENKDCGSISDGCGATVPCGNCLPPATCGANNVCTCVPTTCGAAGKNCGSIPDGCGGNLSCGNCSGYESCGGGGTPNVCGSVCGEAACTQPDGTYLSHFTNAGCTGIESYYLPYENFGYKCRPWSGTGALCGLTPSTVTNKSFKDAAGTCHDDWPAGNTLSNFVRVYR
jgi:hypothetical protein